MNLPNRLTIFRILLVPIVVFFLTIPSCDNRYLFAFIIFVIASLTDHMDGYIARKNKAVTNFGKIMDPLADKVLISSIFICFTGLNLVSSLVTVLTISREFIVTSIRFLVLENKKKVISANIWGKLKTISQMLAVIVVFAIQIILNMSQEKFMYDFMNSDMIFFIQNLIVWLSVVFSWISGVIYVIDNYGYIKVH